MSPSTEGTDCNALFLTSEYNLAKINVINFNLRKIRQVLSCALLLRITVNIQKASCNKGVKLNIVL